MIRFVLFTGFLILISLTAESQTEKEILSTIEEAKELMNRDPVSSKPYLDSLRSSFSSASYKPYLEAKHHMLLGIYYYRIAKMDSSLLYYNKAAQYYKKADSVKQIAMTNINKAMCYTYTGEYEKAIDLSLEALRGFEKKDDLRGISMCNNIIANVYFSKNKYDEAVKYTKKYLNIAIKTKDSTEMASAYNNLGAIYQYTLKFDSANMYFNKAVALARANGNLVNVTNHLQNMASNYLELEQTEKARQAYKEALDAAMKMKDTTSIGRINLNMGKLNTRVQNHDKALEHISEALGIFEMLGNRNLIRKALREMYYHYEAIGDYEKALEYYKVSDSISEVLFSEESDRNIEELRTQYETEKKDRQIKLQNAEIVQKDLEIQRNYLLLGGLVLLIIIASLFIYLRYLKIKQKQALVLEQTRREMERKQTQLLIQSQEQERLRFATDLHDGMGQHISALGLNLQGLKSNQSDKLFDHSQSLLSDIHQEIRNIAFNLMPPILAKEGLVPALKHLLKRIEKSGEIQTSFDAYDMNFRFSKDAEVSVYRVVQELLSNITKYSGAKTISLQMVNHEESVVLMIEDDGFGYDLEEFKNSEGNGWRNISFRLEMLGGDIEIDTSKGQQTSVVTLEILKKGNL